MTTATSTQIDLDTIGGQPAPDRFSATLPRAPRRINLDTIAKNARETCLRRRERVLRHEWSRERLCEILRLQWAGQWNGYVPPAKDVDGTPNRAESRKLLVQLLRDVDAYDGRATGEQ